MNTTFCRANRSTVFIYAVAIIIGAGLFSSCQKETKTQTESDRTTIFASILPHTFLIERIAGNLVDVGTVISKGGSPHSFSPTPKQLLALSKAKILFKAGVPFEESLLPKITASFETLKVVNLQKDISRLKMEAGHSHDHHGHHHGEELDPHTWLDPENARKQASIICETLCELLPQHANAFKENAKALDAELMAVDAEITALLQPHGGKPFIAMHPAFGYFAKAYGLQQISVELAGKPSGLKRLGNLIKEAKEKNIRIVLVQPQFPTSQAETIAKEINGVVIQADPLSKDYISSLKQLSKEIDAALKDPVK